MNDEQMLKAALWWHEQGASVIPCTGKKAAINWKPYQNIPAQRRTITRWHTDGLLQNIAIVLGEVSNGIVCIDLDGDNAVAAFTQAFPIYVDGTFTVVSGSQHGMHVYFRVVDIPNTIRVKNALGGFELRANGCYVIAPPSIHPTTGLPYRVLNRVPMLRVEHLTAVAQWIEGQAPTAPQAVRSALPTRTPNQNRRDRFFESAITSEASRVTAATDGTRNDTLFNAALSLGRYVASGELNAGYVEQVLTSAALGAGLPESEIKRTIASGFRWGAKNPKRYGVQHGR